MQRYGRKQGISRSYRTLNAPVVFAIIIKKRGKASIHSNLEGMVEISDQIVSGELMTCCRTIDV